MASKGGEFELETINGEWIMKGLDLDDPAAIHTVEECRSLIHTIGFLPPLLKCHYGILCGGTCSFRPVVDG